MVEVVGTRINMTRGDNLPLHVALKYKDGREYTPVPGDRVVFTAKKSYVDPTPIIVKDFDMDTLTMELLPEDTKDLAMPSKYVYDIQLIRADGKVDTFINRAILNITEEVG